jgi:hypothetical protein
MSAAVVALDVTIDAVSPDAVPAALTLRAASLAPRGWNGFAVPLVSAAEFARFIAAHRANDPNGTWDESGVREGDGALIYEDEIAVDHWSVAALIDGVAHYALSGWQWQVVR